MEESEKNLHQIDSGSRESNGINSGNSNRYPALENIHLLTFSEHLAPAQKHQKNCPT